MSYKINGVYLSDFGIKIIEPGAKGFGDIAKRKGKTEQNWMNQNGVEPFLEDDEIFYESRHFTLPCLITQMSDESVMGEMARLGIALKGLINLEVSHTNRVYEVYCKEGSSLKRLTKTCSGMAAYTFNLAFEEIDPTKIVLATVPFRDEMEWFTDADSLDVHFPTSVFDGESSIAEVNHDEDLEVFECECIPNSQNVYDGAFVKLTTNGSVIRTDTYGIQLFINTVNGDEYVAFSIPNFTINAYHKVKLEHLRSIKEFKLTYNNIEYIESYTFECPILNFINIGWQYDTRYYNGLIWNVRYNELQIPNPLWGIGFDAAGNTIPLTTVGITEGFSPEGSDWLMKYGCVNRAPELVEVTDFSEGLGDWETSPLVTGDSVIEDGINCLKVISSEYGQNLQVAIPPEFENKKCKISFKLKKGTGSFLQLINGDGGSSAIYISLSNYLDWNTSSDIVTLGTGNFIMRQPIAGANTDYFFVSEISITPYVQHIPNNQFSLPATAPEVGDVIISEANYLLLPQQYDFSSIPTMNKSDRAIWNTGTGNIWSYKELTQAYFDANAVSPTQFFIKNDNELLIYDTPRSTHQMIDVNLYLAQ